MIERIELVVPGAPRTKKTSNRVVFLGRPCPVCRRGQSPRVLPSEAWETWKNAALPLVRAAVGGPLDFPVNCAALFYRDRLTGDAVGYYQGLADLLQEAGVVADDKWIVSWDGSRLLKDAANPRTVVVLSWD